MFASMSSAAVEARMICNSRTSLPTSLEVAAAVANEEARDREARNSTSTLARTIAINSNRSASRSKFPTCLETQM